MQRRRLGSLSSSHRDADASRQYRSSLSREREDEILEETHLTLLGVGESLPLEILWDMVEPGIGRIEYLRLLDRRGEVSFLADGSVIARGRSTRRGGSAAQDAGMSLQDAAHELLSRVGEPMEFADIHEAVSRGRAEVSLKNALAVDDRFVRTDRTVYGLAEWDHEPYDSILGLIGRHLERAGGEARIADIVADITERYSVSGTSVRAFATSDHFVSVKRGTIRLRTAGEVPEETLPAIGEVANCYLDDGSWRLRITVEERMLSGYSCPLPRGFALRLGVPPLTSAELPTDLGSPVSINRKGFSDAIGRLRPLILELGLGPGDLLFVRESRGRGRTLSVTGVPVDVLDRLDTLADQVGVLMGLPLPVDVRTVAKALGLRPASTVAAVAGTLRSRGEEALAELVLDAFGGSRAAPLPRDIAEALGLIDR
jgi:hypothetical protein